MLDTGIYILKSQNIINNKIQKKLYISKGKKHYYNSKKAIDYYIDATVELLKNNEIEKNDGADLYHLAYIDRNDNDIFVTDDYKLRNLCNKISNGSAINVSKFIDIIDKSSNADLLEAIADTRNRRNLHGPYKTAEEAVAAMLSD